MQDKNNHMKSARENAVEFYRVALMFGIVLLHSMTFTPYSELRPTWISNILLSCVDGFVIISGWYGMKFAPSKALRLFGVSFYATCVVCCGLFLYGFFIDKTIIECMIWFIKSVKGYWFLNAYLFLMLLTPLIDAVLDKYETKQLIPILVPFFILTFGWSGGHDLPLIGRVFPSSPGIGSYTFLTLLCCYVVGRLARRFDLDQKLSTKVLLLSLPVLWFFAGMGAGDYSSPFAVGLGLTSFLLVKRIPVRQTYWRFLGPSMFAIYLLHTNKLGIGLLSSCERFLYENCPIPFILVLALSSFIVFMFFVVMDLPRRMFCRFFYQAIQNICNWIDNSYYQILLVLEKHI